MSMVKTVKIFKTGYGYSWKKFAMHNCVLAIHTNDTVLYNSDVLDDLIMNDIITRKEADLYNIAIGHVDREAGQQRDINLIKELSKKLHIKVVVEK